MTFDALRAEPPLREKPFPGILLLVALACIPVAALAVWACRNAGPRARTAVGGLIVFGCLECLLALWISWRGSVPAFALLLAIMICLPNLAKRHFRRQPATGAPAPAPLAPSILVGAILFLPAFIVHDFPRFAGIRHVQYVRKVPADEILPDAAGMTVSLEPSVNDPSPMAKTAAAAGRSYRITREGQVIRTGADGETAATTAGRRWLVWTDGELLFVYGESGLDRLDPETMEPVATAPIRLGFSPRLMRCEEQVIVTDGTSAYLLHCEDLSLRWTAGFSGPFDARREGDRVLFLGKEGDRRRIEAVDLPTGKAAPPLVFLGRTGGREYVGREPVLAGILPDRFFLASGPFVNVERIVTEVRLDGTCTPLLEKIERARGFRGSNGDVYLLVRAWHNDPPGLHLWRISDEPMTVIAYFLHRFSRD